MSTAGERLEAAVWLESNAPNINSSQRAEFFSAVDAYYDEDPVGERSAGALGCIRQDGREFTEILTSILEDKRPSDTP